MFWGDIESTFSDKISANTGWGFTLGKSLNSFISLRGEFITGGVSGSQPKYDRYFNADFYDYHINGTLNILNLIHGVDPCRNFNVFGTLGLGFIQFRTLEKTISTDKIIGHSAFNSVVGGSGEEWETESFIVTGIGFSYRLDKRFTLVAENQWHVINTDRLDAKTGGFKYDILSYTSIGITYKFNFRKNPNTFLDCGKGGTKNYYITNENKQVDSSRYYRSSSNINNYYGKGDTLKVIIIKDTNNTSALERRIENLERNINAPSNDQPIIKKLDEIISIIKETNKGQNNVPVNVTPTNITPNNNDKINELENKIKELENQKKNIVPTNITPDNNDKINELENKIKELENQKNNKVPANNVTTTNNITNIGPDNLSLLSVFFDFNKSVILPSEMYKIEILAKLMSKDQTIKVVVTGHCDQKGTETYNERLSKRRANVVAKVLIDKYKISKERISKEYHGKKNPISQEHSINRRVDFIRQ